MVEMTRHRVNGIYLAVRSWEVERARHPPVVLVPGTGNTAADWDTVALDLSADRIVHAVDLRGHGDSDWPGTYSIDLIAQDLAELLPMLGSLVDVIGHSLGGLAACRALAFGAMTPRRLVLEDVGVLHPRAPSMPARPGGELDFDWGVVEQVRPEIDSPASHWPTTFAAISVPTLVIGGGAASFLPQQAVRELAALVAQGEHLTIDAGHSIHANEPEAFIQAVRAFLDA